MRDRAADLAILALVNGERIAFVLVATACGLTYAGHRLRTWGRP